MPYYSAGPGPVPPSPRVGNLGTQGDMRQQTLHFSAFGSQAPDCQNIVVFCGTCSSETEGALNMPTPARDKSEHLTLVVQGQFHCEG